MHGLLHLKKRRRILPPPKNKTLFFIEIIDSLNAVQSIPSFSMKSQHIFSVTDALLLEG